MSKEDGGPAFPGVKLRDDPPYDGTKIYYAGVTLRDFFAGLAMQSAMINQKPTLPLPMGSVWWERDIARMAYGIADAMLEEGKKE